MFCSCYNKKGDCRIAITFFVAVSLFFFGSAEGDNSNVVVAFCFGLVATKKAMTKLLSPSLRSKPLFCFGCNAEGNNNIVSITFYFGLATSKKVMTELSSLSLL